MGLINATMKYTIKIFKNAKRWVLYLFSSTGSSFDSAMEYCNEQYYYKILGKMKKIESDDFLAYSVGILVVCYGLAILIAVIANV